MPLYPFRDAILSKTVHFPIFRQPSTVCDAFFVVLQQRQNRRLSRAERNDLVKVLVPVLGHEELSRLKRFPGHLVWMLPRVYGVLGRVATERYGQRVFRTDPSVTYASCCCCCRRIALHETATCSFCAKYRYIASGLPCFSPAVAFFVGCTAPLVHDVFWNDRRRSHHVRKIELLHVDAVHAFVAELHDLLRIDSALVVPGPELCDVKINVLAQDAHGPVRERALDALHDVDADLPGCHVPVRIFADADDDRSGCVSCNERVHYYIVNC
eukprot:351876-Chlamydomonas_euryale.AAC.7